MGVQFGKARDRSGMMSRERSSSLLSKKARQPFSELLIDETRFGTLRATDLLFVKLFDYSSDCRHKKWDENPARDSMHLCVVSERIASGSPPFGNA